MLLPVRSLPRGIFIHCVNGKIPSLHYPGGYAESVTVPANAMARIPPELSDAEAAPMGCAGVTTYNALRHTKALPGDRVAIVGVGGLGHLGVQFARAMGFETIAINRGTAKAEDARKLGAHHYIDSTASDRPRRCRIWAGRRWCWPPSVIRRPWPRRSVACSPKANWSPSVSPATHCRSVPFS